MVRKQLKNALLSKAVVGTIKDHLRYIAEDDKMDTEICIDGVEDGGWVFDICLDIEWEIGDCVEYLDESVYAYTGEIESITVAEVKAYLGEDEHPVSEELLNELTKLI